LFLAVVSGQLHEAHYRDQMQMLAHFKEAVFRWDLSEHQRAGSSVGGVSSSSIAAATTGRIDGLITRDTFLRGLRAFFPHKSAAHMAILQSILDRDCMAVPGTCVPDVPAGTLFVDARRILSSGDGVLDGAAVDDEGAAAAAAMPGSTLDSGATNDATIAAAAGGSGTAAGGDSIASSSAPNSSNFLHAIRAQYLSEIESFVSRIRSSLLALYAQRCAERMAELRASLSASEEQLSAALVSSSAPAVLSAKDIRMVLRACDPHRPSDALTDLLKRGCNEPYLSKDSEVVVSRFMHNLVSSGLVHSMEHWCRLATKLPDAAINPQQGDRAAALEAEVRKAAEADMQATVLLSPPQQQPPPAPHPHPTGGGGRKTNYRRTSMDDEAVYMAARTTGGVAALDSHL
jgi:hypothetical protein